MMKLEIYNGIIKDFAYGNGYWGILEGEYLGYL